MSDENHPPVFDGLCHREFNPDIDGWRYEISNSEDFPCVVEARSVLRMFDELRRIQKENWFLKKELASHEKHQAAIFGSKNDDH